MIADKQLQFCKELAALARKHDLRELDGHYIPDLDEQFNGEITFSWKSGHHGKDAGTVIVTQSQLASVKLDIPE